MHRYGERIQLAISVKYSNAAHESLGKCIANGGAKVMVAIELLDRSPRAIVMTVSRAPSQETKKPS